MTDSWQTNKETKRDNSSDRVSRFFVFGMKRFLIIPFEIIFLFGCQEKKKQEQESAIKQEKVFFNQEDFEKLISTKQCPKCDLEGADLSNKDLSGEDLSEAYLIRASLINADLSEENLTSVDARNSDLSQADLTGADLTDTKLDGAILCHTTMSDGKKENSGCKK